MVYAKAITFADMDLNADTKDASYRSRGLKPAKQSWSK